MVKDKEVIEEEVVEEKQSDELTESQLAHIKRMEEAEK